MYSGSLSDAQDLWSHIESALAGRTSSNPPTHVEVKEIVQRAYVAKRADLIESTILSPFAMTHSEFRKSGRRAFGDEYFRKLCDEMRQVTVDAELLVCGFDPDGEGHIFASSREQAKEFGPCTSYDKVSFHAIGSGSFGAMTTLYATFQYRHDEKESESIYRACEAFFAANSASGIGEIGIVSIMHKDSSMPNDFLIIGHEHCVIKAAHHRRLNQPIDTAAVDNIEFTLKSRRIAALAAALNPVPPKRGTD
jgi:hypothetical protein